MSLKTEIVGGVCWTDFDNPQDPEFDEMARSLNFHPLALEDCHNDIQLAKIDDYGAYLFIIFNPLHLDPTSMDLQIQEVEVFLGKDYLVSVHDQPCASIEQAIRDAARFSIKSSGRLFHALIDNTVDQYLPVLDAIGEQIDVLEDQAYEGPSAKFLEDVFTLKRSLITFRRAVGFQREMLNTLLRYDNELIPRDIQPYLRDVYDHVLRAQEMVESYRDLLTGILDIYLTSLSNRTNDVAKLLALIGTLFVVPTLISGVFGMNVPLPYGLNDNPQAFWWVIGGTVVITGSMLSWFKYRGWW
ncbi:MAG: magnesium/cobalt transporter CorA [Gloeobacterales cyanobacterium]